VYLIPKIEQPEQAGLIGGAWMDQKLRALLLARLKPSDFIGPDRVLVEALRGDEEGRFTYLIAESKLTDPARQRLTAIQAALAMKPNIREFDQWMQHVERESILRQMDVALDRMKPLVKPGNDPVVAMSEVVMTFVKLNSRQSSELRDMGDAVDGALETIEQWERGEKYADSVPTGFGRLDRKLGGLSRGHICTLGARPARGKTQFALQVSRNAAHRIQAENRDAVVVIFSAEMTEDELALRLAQTTSGVSTEWMREGMRTDGTPLSDFDRKKFKDALRGLKGLPIVIDPTSSPTTAHMYRQIAAQKALHKDGVDLVVFDYIELAGNTGGKNANETNRIGSIMRGLKQIAKDHNCAVLVLSQLNRNVDYRNSRMPELDDLRQSGDIEALSQQVLFIDWPDSYKTAAGYPHHEVEQRAKYYAEQGGNISIMIAKNRNGRARVGHIMTFTPAITRFEELDEVKPVGELRIASD